MVSYWLPFLNMWWTKNVEKYYLAQEKLRFAKVYFFKCKYCDVKILDTLLSHIEASVTGGMREINMLIKCLFLLCSTSILIGIISS